MCLCVCERMHKYACVNESGQMDERVRERARIHMHAYGSILFVYVVV